MTTETDEWITYTPDEPLPEGNVRIRMWDGWESRQYLSAGGWLGWAEGHIIAYLPEGRP